MNTIISVIRVHFRKIQSALSNSICLCISEQCCIILFDKEKAQASFVLKLQKLWGKFIKEQKNYHDRLLFELFEFLMTKFLSCALSHRKNVSDKSC